MKKKYLIVSIGGAIVIILAVIFSFQMRPFTGKVINEQKPECNFLRGDANNDGNLDLSDAIHVLGYLFQGKTAPGCLDAADVNDDSKIDLSDAIYLLNYLFRGGFPPGAPYPAKGIDHTSDSLTCFKEVIDATCQIQKAKQLCGYGAVSEPCICGGISISEGRCCLGRIHSRDEPCKVQVYAQMKITGEYPNNDLFACMISMKGGTFVGCGPYETIDDEEFQLTDAKTEQRNPSFYNRESDAIIAWEESESEGPNAGKRKIYLCYLDEEIKVPTDCEKQKIFVAEGYNPSVSQYLVWEDEAGVWACDPLLKGGHYSCIPGNPKTLVAEKGDEDREEIWTPLIKENYVLYRNKIIEDTTTYDLYACDLGKESLGEYCTGYRVGSGKIDLPKVGDVSNDGKVIVYATRNIFGEYEIFASIERGKKVLIRTGSLISSPQVVFLRNDELRQKGYEDEGYYAVWKDALPGNKYNIHVKLIREEDSPLPPTEYKVITPGYTGANGQVVFDQLGSLFVQDKIIGKFEGSSLNIHQNFINQRFTCDLRSLEQATPEEILGGFFGKCLRKQTLEK